MVAVVAAAVLLLAAQAAYPVGGDCDPELVNIVMLKTVGVGPDCADTTEITLDPNTEVTYCFYATNDSRFVWLEWRLVDLNTGFEVSGVNLGPGESIPEAKATYLYSGGTVTNIARVTATIEVGGDLEECTAFENATTTIHPTTQPVQERIPGMSLWGVLVLALALPGCALIRSMLRRHGA